MKKLLNDFIKNEDGVTAIEYAVIGVAMATLLGVLFSNGGTFHSALTNAMERIAEAMGGAGR